MKYLALLTSALLAACTPAAPPPGAPTAFEQAGCRIARVVDGDTVRVACGGGGTVPVRLTGFDTPETFRPRCASELARGRAATQHLSALIAQAERVDLQMQGKDRYDRSLARLTLEGRDVARRMIADGHAVPYAGGRRQNWCG